MHEFIKLRSFHEFIKLRSFLTQQGISHFTTPPHTPELNATAERRHRHIVETGRTLLYHANLPQKFWSFAFLTATYLINRLPTPVLDMQSPYEILHKTKSNIHHLHSFGCLCFPWLRPYTKSKLQPRSTPCIFLGYSPSQYAYHCFDPKTEKIYTSRHVSFFDHQFPYHTMIPQPVPTETSTQNTSTPPYQIIPIQTTLNTSSHDQPIGIPTAGPATEVPLSTSPGNISTHSLPDSTIPTTVVPTNKSTRDIIVTRSKHNIYKRKRMFATSKHPLPKNLEPSCVREAMKYTQWRQAISAELDALIGNGTWTLVPPTKGQNVVGCKWLFRIKRNPDGSISRYKARLVAKGFTQSKGIDFQETFAPVVRPQTIKVVLTLALGHSWKMHQLDVNNAFLQGSLTEQVFMAQPPGFKNTQFPNHVCKLNKAIYGLRQAPRAWHDSLKSFINSYGFFTSKSDPSLFIYISGSIKIYFLVYVDDLLLTGNDNEFMIKFIEALSRRFSLKNMGYPHYFLGVELIPIKNGLYLSQHKYIRETLEKFDMEGAKPSPTPLSSTSKLQLQDGSAAIDATHFRSIIGALQYLNLTRPDYHLLSISYLNSCTSQLHFIFNT